MNPNPNKCTQPTEKLWNPTEKLWNPLKDGLENKKEIPENGWENPKIPENGWLAPTAAKVKTVLTYPPCSRSAFRQKFSFVPLVLVLLCFVQLSIPAGVGAAAAAIKKGCNHATPFTCYKLFNAC